MKTVFTFLILFTIVAVSYGQVKFEKGYFINNDDKKIECLIKNNQWKFNPTEFTYKVEGSGESQTGNVNSVKEFAIYNYYKFVSADVKIDRSANPKATIATEKDPVWKQEKLFLKVLVEGKARLFVFDDSNLQRFFYSVNDKPISQLVYKEYRVDMSLVKNTTFRQQIWEDLQYRDSNMNDVKNINYNAQDLEAYFRAYNQSFGETITEIRPPVKRSHFSVKITPGINFASGKMSIPGGPRLNEVTYPSNQTFRFGIEGEWLLPLNKPNWAVVFEPTYQSYHSDSQLEEGIIDYQSVEFPLGFRYYYHLSDQTNLFVNGFYIAGFAMNFDSQIALKREGLLPDYYDVEPSGNIAFGGGVNYKKFSMEARYYSNRNLLEINNSSLDPMYSRFSLILGYRIFSTKR